MIYAKENVKLNTNVSPLLILQFNLHILSLGRSQGKYGNLHGECKLCYVCQHIYTCGSGASPTLLPSSLAPSSCVAAVFTMKNNEITVGALCSFLGTPLGYMTCSSRETLLEIINS